MTTIGAESQLPSHFTEPSIVDVRGLPTAYRRRGSGAPVVFLHAGGMTRAPWGLTRKWLPFHERLSERVDLIAPEQPGFGDTPAPGWLRSVDDVVVHLDDLLETLGSSEIHLVGHSLGGWIAARLAVLYPRRLRSLTLLSPLGLRVAKAPAFDYFRMTPDEADDVLFGGHGERYAEQLEMGERVEATVLSYREITNTARIAWNPRYDVRFDRLLSRVTCPSLVVAAEQDNVLPRVHCERYAELLPDARLEVIAGNEVPTGHLALTQEPQRLADLIADFVDSQEGRTDA